MEWFMGRGPCQEQDTSIKSWAHLKKNAFWAWLALCKFPKMAKFENAHLSQF